MNGERYSIQFIIIQIIVCLICGELTFQLAYGAYEVEPYTLDSEPHFCLVCDTKRGFGLKPGEYQVAINQAVKFTCTIGQDSFRIVSPTEKRVANKGKRLDIHGCSFVFGMGVEDSLTYPYLLQKARSNLSIRNLAVPGSGTLQALMLLEEQVKNNDLPEAIILNYASFHEERNVLGTKYREALHYGFQRSNEDVKPLFASCLFPYVSLLDTSDGLEINHIEWDDLYKHYPYRDVLASVNFVQTTLEQYHESKENASKGTRKILKAINKVCQLNQIEIVVALMTSDEQSKTIQAFCRAQGIKTLDLSLDLDNPTYTHLPYDAHPNALAHSIYAERITLDFLNNF